MSDAILDTTAELVLTQGLPAVTMSRIAGDTGIGRATLYKYFGDVGAILVAWHERQIKAHLHQLLHTRSAAAAPGGAVEAALLTYAKMVRVNHGISLAALLHSLPHARHAHQHLHDHVQKLIEEAVVAGQLRADVSPAELARFALAGLSAAEGTTEAATRRLVSLVIAAMSGK